MKAQSLAWFGHVHRMPYDRMVKKYMNGHPCQQDHYEDPKIG
jgi:hypothetical protein